MHQGNRPIRSLAWSGLTGRTTLVIEALDAGCPFPGGYVGYTHADGDPGRGALLVDHAGRGAPAESGEVFINGQHDPASRPKPDRALVRRRDAAARAADGLLRIVQPVEDVGAAVPRSPATATTASTSTATTRWAIDFAGSPENHSLGPMLGQFHIGCIDWGSSCGYSIVPRGVTTRLEASRYLHVRMTVDVPSTLRRYPGMMITRRRSRRSTIRRSSHVYDVPVMSRLGPLDAEGTGHRVDHPRAPSRRCRTCSCSSATRAAGASAISARRPTRYGRRTHWENGWPAVAAGAGAGRRRGLRPARCSSTSTRRPTSLPVPGRPARGVRACCRRGACPRGRSQCCSTRSATTWRSTIRPTPTTAPPVPAQLQLHAHRPPLRRSRHLELGARRRRGTRRVPLRD